MLQLIYIFVTGFRAQPCESSLGLVGSVDLLISIGLKWSFLWRLNPHGSQNADMNLPFMTPSQRLPAAETRKRTQGFIKPSNIQINAVRLHAWCLMSANLRGWTSKSLLRLLVSLGFKVTASSEKDRANWSNTQLQPKSNNDDKGGGSLLPDGISWTEDGR